MAFHFSKVWGKLWQSSGTQRDRAGRCGHWIHWALLPCGLTHGWSWDFLGLSLGSLTATPHPHTMGPRLGGRSLRFMPVLLLLLLPMMTVPDFPLGTHQSPMGDMVCVKLDIPHPDLGLSTWLASFHPLGHRGWFWRSKPVQGESILGIWVWTVLFKKDILES